MIVSFSHTLAAPVKDQLLQYLDEVRPGWETGQSEIGPYINQCNLFGISMYTKQVHGVVVIIWSLFDL